MNVGMKPESRDLARRAIDSHDGMAAKRAQILLSYSDTKTIEKVVEETGWTADTVRNVLEIYEQEGDSILHPRPMPKKPLLDNFLITTHEGPEWEYYKGALIHSHLELNERVIAEIKKLLPNPVDKRILEVGAGEGALAMMLSDAGYEIECIDVVDYGCFPSDIPLRIMDVDQGLIYSLKGEHYDLVLAVDVIEHLLHPFKLVEEAFALLKPGGSLVICTLNITNFVSRAKFLTDGNLLSFGMPRYDIDHSHISAIPWYTMEYIFRKVGFKEVTIIEAKRLSIISLHSWKHAFHSIFRLISYVVVHLLSFGQRAAFSVGKEIIVTGKRPE